MTEPCSASPRFEPSTADAAVASFCRQIHAFSNRQELLHAVAGKIPAVADARGGAVLLLDNDRHQLLVAAISMDDAHLKSLIDPLRFPFNAEKWNLQPLGDSAAIIDCLKRGCQPSALNQRLFSLLENSVLAPLHSGQGLSGLIWAIDRSTGSFQEAEKGLKALAGAAAAAMTAVKMREQLNVSHERVKDFDAARDQVIHHLSHALKTPVSVLIASLKLLAKHLNLLPDNAWDPIYQRAQRNLQRLLDIEYEMEDILGDKKLFDQMENPALESKPDDFFHNVNIEFLVHELKDPVGIVEAGIRMLMDKASPLSAPGQERTLHRILRNTRRTREMLNELLEVGRAHNVCFNCRPFHPLSALQRIVIEVVEINDPQLYEELKNIPTDPERLKLLTRKGILIETATEMEKLCIEQDEVKFRQIIGNLIKNGFYYRRRHLLIHLACHHEDFSVSVRDDGPGIAQIHHEAIFQRYKQVTACPGLARSGHGLGLAMARFLARGMGGDITVDSELGQGALFQLRLPVTYK